MYIKDNLQIVRGNFRIFDKSTGSKNLSPVILDTGDLGQRLYVKAPNWTEAPRSVHRVIKIEPPVDSVISVIFRPDS